MCETNPRHTKILRLEFFTSHPMASTDFDNLVAVACLEMEQLANASGRLRCHIHEQEIRDDNSST
jgi:hypothetical protein